MSGLDVVDGVPIRVIVGRSELIFSEKEPICLLDAQDFLHIDILGVGRVLEGSLTLCLLLHQLVNV